jgi:monoamine oxidase
MSRIHRGARTQPLPEPVKKSDAPAQVQDPARRFPVPVNVSRDVPAKPLVALDATPKHPAAVPVKSVGYGDQPKLDADVLIVGGGWSGQKAASVLIAAGVSALVLEARSVPGGRVRTDYKTFDGPHEKGAAWVHDVDDNDVAEKATDAGIKLTVTQLDGNIYVDGRRGTPEELAEYKAALNDIDHAVDRAAAQGLDLPAGQLYEAKTPIAMAAVANYGELDMGMSLDRLSSADADKSRHAGIDALPEGGMRKLMKADVGDVPVQTDTPVKKVKWGPSGVEVTTANGDVLRARRVLLTVSTGVLASGKIEFDPPLPEWKRDAFLALPMGVLNKVAVEFDSDVFQFPDGTKQPSNDWVMNVESNGEAPWAFLMKPKGKPIAIGFSGVKSDGASSQAALDTMMDKLKNVFGRGIEHHVRATDVTDWSKDEWTLGSYSYAKPGFAHMREKLAQPVEDRLFWGGEATANGPAQMVHGASQSGVIAAHALIDSLKAEDANRSP